jgi:hypothetical protein
MNLIESFKLKWDISLLSLIVTNVIVIVLAVIQKWDLSVLVLLYVIQSFIIGFFHFLKLLNKKNIDITNFPLITGMSLSAIKTTKIILSIVYWWLYQSILGIYLIFALIFSLASAQLCSSSAQNVCTQTASTNWLFFGISIVIFFINHLISYIINFKKDTEKPETVWALIFMPYLRFIPIHIILSIGVIFFKSSLTSYSLILFLLLKTAIDVYTHNYIHNLADNQSDNSNLKIIRLSAVTPGDVLPYIFLGMLISYIAGPFLLILFPIILFIVLDKIKRKQ